MDAVDACRDRAGEERLRGARHVLEQHVSSRHEPGEDEPNLLALAVNHGLQIRDQRPRGIKGRGEVVLALFPFCL